MFVEKRKDLRLLESTKSSVEEVAKASTHTLLEPEKSKPYRFMKHGLWAWLRGTEGYYIHDSSRRARPDSAFEFDVYHKGRLSRKYTEHLSMKIDGASLTVSRYNTKDDTTTTITLPEDIKQTSSLNTAQRYALRRARKFASSINVNQLMWDASNSIISAAGARQ